MSNLDAGKLNLHPAYQESRPPLALRALCALCVRGLLISTLLISDRGLSAAIGGYLAEAHGLPIRAAQAPLPPGHSCLVLRLVPTLPSGVRRSVTAASEAAAVVVDSLSGSLRITCAPREACQVACPDHKAIRQPFTGDPSLPCRRTIDCCVWSAGPVSPI
ncbi:hypothetical protein BO71DRAFT_398947 [Aspergillus ellipticus CBS 707.79]|uniref:Uncharacterized protein n=1 Tax=Aspergillus ellipticus CBS 707.79 TaxID=1448320 RepID=A0A319DAD4_9EURO|nr:hypothetical protein BO71DRAFT_398947 [Aspergillus ellipticus CBS 707.79]